MVRDPIKNVLTAMYGKSRAKERANPKKKEKAGPKSKKKKAPVQKPTPPPSPPKKMPTKIKNKSDFEELAKIVLSIRELREHHREHGGCKFGAVLEVWSSYADETNENGRFHIITDFIFTADRKIICRDIIINDKTGEIDFRPFSKYKKGLNRKDFMEHRAAFEKVGYVKRKIV